MEMRRKVVQHGPSTLIVSLPSKWVKDNNILKGQEVDIANEKNQLVISPLTDPKFQRAMLDTNEFSFSVVRGIAALYQNGCDEVRIKFNNPKTIKKIPEFINNLLPGYEIINQSQNSCVIRNISIGLNTEFDPLLRRLFLVTLQLSKNVTEVLESGDLEKLQDILVLENTNNKFTNLCMRMLNKKSAGQQYKHITCLYNIISSLEKIGDEYDYLTKYLLDNNKVKMKSKCIKMLKETNEMLKLFYSLFYKFEKNKTHQITEYRKFIVKQAFDKSIKDQIHYRIGHYAVNIAQNIFDSFGDLMCIKLGEE